MKKMHIYFFNISKKFSCGKGNEPKPPVDGIDECCRIHDACYDEYDTHILDKCCAGWVPRWACSSYLEKYDYECNPAAKEIIHCKTKAEGNNECEIFLCNCDK
jgi:hypothetical protein